MGPADSDLSANGGWAKETSRELRLSVSRLSKVAASSLKTQTDRIFQLLRAPLFRVPQKEVGIDFPEGVCGIFFIK